MYKYLIAFALLFQLTNSKAQQNKYALKLYNLTTYEQFQHVSTYAGATTTINTNILQAFHPTIGLQWKGRKNRIHEFEVTNFKLQFMNENTIYRVDSLNQTTTFNGNKNWDIHIGFRYERIYHIGKATNEKLNFFLGYGLNPYFKQSRNIPVVSSAYPRFVTDAGVKVFFIPRVTYNLSKRVFVDLNIPISVADFYVEHTNYKDPKISQVTQNPTTYNFEAFQRFFSARIGVGVNL